MRYTIETTHEGEKANVWNTITALAKKDHIRIIEKGEPLQQMKENLARIKEAMTNLQSAGLDREVLIAFIRHRTKQRVSLESIEEVLDLQQSFFKKFEVKK